MFVIRYLVVYVNMLTTLRDMREHLNRTSDLLFMVYLYTQLVVCPIKYDTVIEYHDVEGSCPNLYTVALQPPLLCMNEHDRVFVQIIHLRSAVLEAGVFLNNSLNSPRFMEPECLLTHSLP